MQIVDTQTGAVVEYEPGQRVEMDFVADAAARIIAKGVALKTTTHVQKDIIDGLNEAIYALKLKV